MERELSAATFHNQTGGGGGMGEGASVEGDGHFGSRDKERDAVIREKLGTVLKGPILRFSLVLFN